MSESKYYILTISEKPLKDTWTQTRFTSATECDETEGQMCVDVRKWTLIAWEERKRRKINLCLFFVLDMKAFLQLVLTCSCNGLSFIKMRLNCTTETSPQFTNINRRPVAVMISKIKLEAQKVQIHKRIYFEYISHIYDRYSQNLIVMEAQNKSIVHVLK